ncbi:hypothetical protein, partial [Bifidobacterium adolescentis]|uniref:hypothetical protein n=1 Tax=Bifidobacterium adolescentis TaxID=1680 RepID=UPI00210AA11D
SVAVITVERVRLSGNQKGLKRGIKSKTQDKKRLNALGMHICALFAVLAVVFPAFITTVPHPIASETGNPASVK